MEVGGDKSEILYSICRCSDLNNKLYTTEFPFNSCKYLKICGLVRGRIQGR